MKIGEFLVHIGAMTQVQVDEVIKAQQGGDSRPFGEIANSLGFVDDTSIKRFADYLDTSNADD